MPSRCVFFCVDKIKKEWYNYKVKLPQKGENIMKKIIALALAAILLTLALVSCDPKNGNGNGAESSTPESSSQATPVDTSDKSPDAPFNGEDDAI